MRKTIRRFSLLAILVAVVLGLAGCAQQLSPEGVSAMDLQKVSEKTIFFGHQSVGWNILHGVEDVLKQQPEAKLTIQEAESIDSGQGPAFIHATIGENYDPISKLQAFDQLIRGGIGDRVDIAFMKFCYVDFNKDTDVEQLFTSYKQTLDDLSKAYPQTTFAYVTTPLMAPDPGVKGLLKSLLGRNEDRLANDKRHQFNELMRREYGATGRLFDLAAVEATYPDGKVCTFSVNGEAVPCLIVDYTNDGGHLNELGRQVLAGQLLKFLAALD